ncbi:MAG TPA: hypothetical protein V6D29_15900 [Leptolyngbyaceae cyanobacterium]
MLELSLLALLSQPVTSRVVLPPLDTAGAIQVAAVSDPVNPIPPTWLAADPSLEASSEELISFATVNTVFSIRLDGAERQLLVSPPVDNAEAPLDELVWAADGQQLAAIYNYGEVYVWRRDTSTATPVFKSQCPDQPSLDLTWATEGRLLIKEFCNAPTSNSTDSLRLYLSDARGLAGTRLFPLPEGLESDLYLSPDGEQIAFVRAGHIYRVAIDGMRRPQQVTREPGIYSAAGSPLAWSPDGSKLAFYEGTYPNQRLYVMDADGRNRRLLTPEPNHQIYRSRLFWAPDSRRLAFYVPHDPPYSNEEVVQLVDTATGTLKTLTVPGFYDALSWSPDGQKLALASGKIESQSVYVMDLATEKFIPLTEEPLAQVLKTQWSANGHWIAFTAEPANQELGNQILYTVKPDGSELRSLTSPDEYVYPFTWQPQ